MSGIQPEIHSTARMIFPINPTAPYYSRASGILMLIEKVGRYSGYNSYSLPGGRIEAGETPYEAMKREVQEELGINPQGIEFANKTFSTTLKINRREKAPLVLNQTYFVVEKILTPTAITLEPEILGAEVLPFGWCHIPLELLSFSVSEMIHKLRRNDDFIKLTVNNVGAGIDFSKYLNRIAAPHGKGRIFSKYPTNWEKWLEEKWSTRPSREE